MVTVGVYGAGGFGKSTLARMVSADQQVRRFFRGRIYVVRVGRDVRSDLEIAAKVREAALYITGIQIGSGDSDMAGADLGRLLNARDRTLLVLDDVWASEQLAPFLIGGSRCVRMVTTRLPEILPADAQRIEIGEMTFGQARRVLTWGLPSSALSEDVVRRLVGSCGRWPLLLRLASSLIIQLVSTGLEPAAAAGEALDQLSRDGLAGLDEAGAPFDAGDPYRRNRAVRASVKASTDLLPRDGDQRFAELGIFTEGESVPLAVVARLWHGSAGYSAAQARVLCHRLNALSLAAVDPADGGSVAVHSVFHSYLRSELGAAGLARANAQFVDSVASALPEAGPLTAQGPGPGSAWWEEPEEYLRDHAIEHLLGADRIEQAEALAGDIRWVESRLYQRGPSAPWRDLTRVPTPTAAVKADELARIAHLLVPIEPAYALAAVLYSRLQQSPNWHDQIVALQAAAAAPPVLRSIWPLPDLPNPALRHILVGHDGPVSQVVISPDGAWLASTGRDGTVRIWERPTWENTVTLIRHGSGQIVISPDGTWLATTGGSDRGAVQIWDRATGATAVLTGDTHWANTVAISPDGTWLAAAGNDGRVWIWDRARWTNSKTLTHTKWVYSVAISPDGTWLATVGGDGTLRLWDRTTGKNTSTFHSRWVHAIAISPDGAWLIGSNTEYDERVYVWNRMTGEDVAILTGDSAAISPDGTWLATYRTASHSEVRIWDRETGENTATLAGLVDLVTVAISPDGTWLVTTGGGHGGSMRIWDPTSGEVIATLSGHTEWVTAVKISPDGTWLASASNDGTVRIWDRASAAGSAEDNEYTRAYASATTSAGGAWLATLANDQIVRIWDRATGEVTAVLADVDRHHQVRLIAISPDGTWLATDGASGTALIWDRATGLNTRILGDTGWAAAVVISPDGTWLATANANGDGAVQIWDTASWESTATLTGHDRPVTKIVISPDSTWLVTTSADGTAQIWDRATGDNTITLTVRTDWFASVVISPDGTWLATAGVDGTVQIWDRATGENTATLAGHTRPVTDVVISPDGTWMVTKDSAGTAHRWDRPTGTKTATLADHDRPVTAVAVSPDGAWLATTSSDPNGTVLIWSTAHMQVISAMRVERGLRECMWISSHELLAFGGAGLYHFEWRPNPGQLSKIASTNTPS